METILREERKEYLRYKPQTKGNGYYERDLMTAFGELTGIQIPRTRHNGFKSVIIPYRKHSIEDLDALIRAMNVLERLFKELKRRLKSSEMFQSEVSFEKYLYWLLNYQNEKFLYKKLKNWEYYFQFYCEQKLYMSENIHSEVIL